MDINKNRSKGEQNQLRVKKDVLLRAITHQRLSKTQLQEKTQVSIPTINKLLRGEAVRPIIVGKIAHSLDVSIDELIEDWDNSEKLE